jgi:hypothetical protein
MDSLGDRAGGQALRMRRGNLEFTDYHSGHMIYLNVDALKQLKSDLVLFYSRAAERGT